MTQDDRTYFAQRADIELQLAERAILPEVAAVHHKLADAYCKRICSNDRGQIDGKV